MVSGLVLCLPCTRSEVSALYHSSVPASTLLAGRLVWQLDQLWSYSGLSSLDLQSRMPVYTSKSTIQLPAMFWAYVDTNQDSWAVASFSGLVSLLLLQLVQSTSLRLRIPHSVPSWWRTVIAAGLLAPSWPVVPSAAVLTCLAMLAGSCLSVSDSCCWGVGSSCWLVTRASDAVLGADCPLRVVRAWKSALAVCPRQAWKSYGHIDQVAWIWQSREHLGQAPARRVWGVPCHWRCWQEGMHNFLAMRIYTNTSTSSGTTPRCSKLALLATVLQSTVPSRYSLNGPATVFCLIFCPPSCLLQGTRTTSPKPTSTWDILAFSSSLPWLVPLLSRELEDGLWCCSPWPRAPLSGSAWLPLLQPMQRTRLTLLPRKHRLWVDRDCYSRTR